MKRRGFLQAVAAMLGCGAAPVMSEGLRDEFARIHKAFDEFQALKPSLVLRHYSGAKPCGGIAVRLKHYPAANAPIRSADFLWPDGSQVKAYDPVCCGTCGGRLGSVNRAHIEDEAFPGKRYG